MALKTAAKNKSGLCKMSIDEEFTIYTIDALKQGLSEEIELYEKFELNLAEVEEIDSAGIQLLLALKKEILKKNKTFKLTELSVPVSTLIESYGLSECFKEGAA